MKTPVARETFWPLDPLPPLTMMTRSAPPPAVASGWATCVMEVDVTVIVGRSSTDTVLRALIAEALAGTLSDLDTPLEGGCQIVHSPVGDILVGLPAQPPLGSCSLGIGAVTRRPVALALAAAEAIAVRSMVYVALRYDSQLLSAEYAAALLQRLKVRLMSSVSQA